MGSGIAQCCAQHGFNVVLFDLDPDTVAASKSRMELAIHNLVAKKKISADDQVFEKIHFTSDIRDCVADLIIEAVIEKADVKADLFNKLSGINKEHTVFATNTSSLSVTNIAEQVSRPSQLAGMHFFNPATMMKLVEVVKTKYSSKETIGILVALAKKMGKTPVLCNDAPGFIVNHVARPYYLEALYLSEHQQAGMETIDALMEASGFRMGPFKLMDLIGNDINYSVSCIVYDALNKPERLKPSAIQKEKVDSGQLGRKTGKGYYVYNQ